MVAAFERNDVGASPEVTALALWRAYRDAGLRSWIVHYGLPDRLTHSTNVVELDGLRSIQDAYFNVGCRIDLDRVLQSLEHGQPVAMDVERRDRKVCICDPAEAPEWVVAWIEAQADKELEPRTSGPGAGPAQIDRR